MQSRSRFHSFLSDRSTSDRPLYDRRYSISRIDDRTSRVERHRGKRGTAGGGADTESVEDDQIIESDSTNDN